MCVGPLVVMMLATPRFEDVTTAAGLTNSVGLGANSDYGSPAAWIDWNQDGWPDLVLGDRSGPTRLFLNDSGTLPFVEESPPELKSLVGATSLLPFELSPGHGLEGRRTALLVVHRDVTGLNHYGDTPGEAGALTLLTIADDGSLSTIPVARPATWLDVATAGDLDGDGHDDLFLASYICGSGAAPVRTLFRLERDALGFRLSADDPIAAPGCYPVPMMTDYYGDGRPVLMVTTDYGTLDAPSFVYSGNGKSETLPGVYGMGIGASDTNGDGHLDYLLTSIGPDLTLTSYSPAPGGPLQRTIGLSGRNTEWGADGVRFKWGPAYFDADNDGDEELWITAGFSGLAGPAQSSSAFSAEIFGPEPNARDAFLDDGIDIGEEAGLPEVTGKRAVILADFDRDGRMDALVTGLEARFLYRNVSEGGHWISLRIPPRVGARYRVTGCGRTWVREWSGMQTVAAHDRVIHVGLGECAGPVEVSVRWPWLAERALGALEVDRVHEIDDPGSIWLEPATASPGSQVSVRTTLPGEVTVGGVRLEGGRGVIAAPASLGVTRLPVTWDGLDVALRVELEVAESAADVLVDPWPVRRGVEARVLAATGPEVEPGDGVSPLDAAPNLERFTPTGDAVTLVVDGVSVAVPSVEAVSSDSVVDYESVGIDVRVRAALLDGLGAASPSAPVDGATPQVAAIVGSTSTPLEVSVPPYYSAYVADDGDTITVKAGGSTVGELGDPRGLGPVDLSKSHLWVVTPIVRADGQDVVECVLMLRDSARRAVPPDASWSLAVQGGPSPESSWKRVELGQGASGWYARVRVGTEVGALAVTSGPLTATVLAMPPDPIDVTPLTTLERDGDMWILIPRDRFGQRLGSGVTTEPPFMYVRWGVYARPAEGDELSLTVGDGLSGYHDGSSVTWTVTAAPPAPSGSCAQGAHRSPRASPLIILLVLLVARRLAVSRPSALERLATRWPARRPRSATPGSRR